MIEVRAGDVWEFNNHGGFPADSYCILWITRVIEVNNNRLDDEYEYIVLDSDDLDEWNSGMLTCSPLTMLDRVNGAYWERLV